MSLQVLIVEDEVDLANLIEITLTDAGYGVKKANCGARGLQLALNQHFDLLLLDVMLPKVDGLEICRRVRERDPIVPIMLLTARNTETDRVMGLNLGADDYLTKPFSIRELAARVAALIRRSTLNNAVTSQPSAIVHRDFTIDPVTHKTQFKQHAIELTATEFELLYFLAQHPTQVFNRSQLLDSVWGYHHIGYEHTVNSHINRLRAKLEYHQNLPKLVHTIWGVGYKFEYLQNEQ